MERGPFLGDGAEKEECRIIASDMEIPIAVPILPCPAWSFIGSIAPARPPRETTGKALPGSRRGASDCMGSGRQARSAWRRCAGNRCGSAPPPPSTIAVGPADSRAADSLRHLSATAWPCSRPWDCGETKCIGRIGNIGTPGLSGTAVQPTSCPTYAARAETGSPILATPPGINV